MLHVFIYKHFSWKIDTHPPPLVTISSGKFDHILGVIKMLHVFIYKHFSWKIDTHPPPLVTISSGKFDNSPNRLPLRYVTL